MNTTRSRMNPWDRFGAACGAAYVLLILVGNQIAQGNSTDPHPSGAKDLADFSAGTSATDAIGSTMEVLGFVAFIFFLGWFVHALRSRGGAAPWLASAAGLAGGITLSVKIASFMPMAAGSLDHKELTPSLARVLTDMNGAAFVITFVTFGTFLVAGGAAVLASGLLGRVAGWFGVVLGTLTVALTLVTGADPVDTNPMPFLGGLLWVLVVSVRLTWKGPRAESAERAAAPVPVAA